jgi:hypothetical protein
MDVKVSVNTLKEKTLQWTLYMKTLNIHHLSANNLRNCLFFRVEATKQHKGCCQKKYGNMFLSFHHLTVHVPFLPALSP